MKVKFAFNVTFRAGLDVETQQKGLVILFFQQNLSTQLFASRTQREVSRQMLNVFPIRISSMHICLPNNPAFSFIKSAAMAAAPPEVRARMRFHLGE
jgi:hypothetical protein